MPFGRVRIVAVARTDHPVATRRPPIPPTLLRAHPQIVLRDSAQGSSPALNVLEGGLRWTVTDIGAKKELILAGMGWGGLPEHVVADELADRTLDQPRSPRAQRGDAAEGRTCSTHRSAGAVHQLGDRFRPRNWLRGRDTAQRGAHAPAQPR